MATVDAHAASAEQRGSATAADEVSAAADSAAAGCISAGVIAARTGILAIENCCVVN